MGLLTTTPRSPYLNAYLALLPGCALGTLGLLIYTLVCAPGAVDLGLFLIALVMVLVWFGYSLVVGVFLVSLYTVPLIWGLLRMRAANPVSMLIVSVLPGAALWSLGGADHRKFSLFLLGFGACTGLSYCVLAYRQRTSTGPA